MSLSDIASNAGIVGGRRRRTHRKQRGGVNFLGKALNFVTGNTPAVPAAPEVKTGGGGSAAARGRSRSLKRSRTRSVSFIGGRKRSSRKRSSHKRSSHKRSSHKRSSHKRSSRKRSSHKRKIGGIGAMM